MGLLIVLLLLAQFASAKTAEQIIERHLLVCGGIEKLTAVKSIYFEGVRTIGADSCQIKITKEQNKFCCTEVISGDENVFLLVTERGASQFFSGQPNFSEEIPFEKSAGLQLQLDTVGPLVDYLTKGHTVALVGRERLEENSCFTIKLKTKFGVEVLYWIDTSSYLVKQSSIRVIGEGTNETITTYMNYLEINGIKFAQTYIINELDSSRPKNCEQISIEKIWLNPTIDPTTFQPS